VPPFCDGIASEKQLFPGSMSFAANQQYIIDIIAIKFQPQAPRS
jgi:hypothetical protein